MDWYPRSIIVRPFNKNNFLQNFREIKYKNDRVSII